MFEQHLIFAGRGRRGGAHVRLLDVRDNDINIHKMDWCACRQ